MLTSGDVVTLDLGLPHGSEAGMTRPAVVVTAQRVLSHDPRVVQVVPLTTTIRRYESEVIVEPDVANGLRGESSAQCQHIRAIATTRIDQVIGNVGAISLAQIRDTLTVLLDA